MDQPDKTEPTAKRGRPARRGKMVRLTELWVPVAWAEAILGAAEQQEEEASEIVRRLLEGSLTLDLTPASDTA